MNGSLGVHGKDKRKKKKLNLAHVIHLRRDCDNELNVTHLPHVDSSANSEITLHKSSLTCTLLK